MGQGGSMFQVFYKTWVASNVVLFNSMASSKLVYENDIYLSVT